MGVLLTFPIMSTGTYNKIFLSNTLKKAKAQMRIMQVLFLSSISCRWSSSSSRCVEEIRDLAANDCLTGLIKNPPTKKTEHIILFAIAFPQNDPLVMNLTMGRSFHVAGPSSPCNIHELRLGVLYDFRCHIFGAAGNGNKSGSSFEVGFLEELLDTLAQRMQNGKGFCLRQWLKV